MAQQRSFSIQLSEFDIPWNCAMLHKKHKDYKRLTSSKHNAKLLPSDTCITYVTACTYPIWYISCIFMWVCLRIRWIRYLKIQQFRIIFHLKGLYMTMWLCWPHFQTHPCDLLSPKESPLHFFTTLQSLHRHRELDLFWLKLLSDRWNDWNAYPLVSSNVASRKIP